MPPGSGGVIGPAKNAASIRMPSASAPSSPSGWVTTKRRKAHQDPWRRSAEGDGVLSAVRLSAIPVSDRPAHGPSQKCRRERRRLAASIFDSRVQPGVAQVDQEIEDQEDERGEEDGPLEHGI